MEGIDRPTDALNECGGGSDTSRSTLGLQAFDAVQGVLHFDHVFRHDDPQSSSLPNTPKGSGVLACPDGRISNGPSQGTERTWPFGSGSPMGPYRDVTITTTDARCQLEAVAVPGMSVPHSGWLEMGTKPLDWACRYHSHVWAGSCPKMVE